MASSHSDTAFLTVEKSMTFRGAREHWVNVYHLDNVPPDSGSWSTLYQAVIGDEALFLDTDVQFERGEGHTPGTPPVLVWEYDSPPAGEGGPTGSYSPGAGFLRAPGDVAMWIRYGTTQRSKLGKPIYLRNYYHAVWIDSTKDQIVPSQLTQLGGYATKWVNGWPVNGVTYRRAGPRGAVAQNHAQSTWTTTRTLKARGKRRMSLPPGTTIQRPPIIIPFPIP